MPIFLFLDEQPDPMERTSGVFTKIYDRDLSPWMTELGFMWCGELDPDSTYFLDSTRVTPYPDLLTRRDWLVNVIARYKRLLTIRNSPEFNSRYRNLRRDIEELEDRMEQMLQPVRDFTTAELKGKGDHWLMDPESRQRERKARVEMQEMYTKIKSSPEYVELQNRRDALLESGRDILEAALYPKTREEAEAEAASSGAFPGGRSRTVMPTLEEKIATLDDALASLVNLSGQKRFLSKLLRSTQEKHERFGIAVSPKLEPMPTGIIDLEDFLSELLVPIPKKRIFILQSGVNNP